MTDEEYAAKLALVGKLRQRASPRNEHASARIRGFTEGLTGEENPSGALDNPQYADDARAGFNAGNWTSLGSDIPGPGSASKAMLLLPAALRSKSAQILNSKVMPFHSTKSKYFTTEQNQLPARVNMPAFHIVGRDSQYVPWGNQFGDDLNDLADMLLVGKPGRMVPEKQLGHIFDSSDVGSSGALRNPTNAMRKRALEDMRTTELVDLHGADEAKIIYGWPNSKQFLADYRNADAGTRKYEMAMKQSPRLTPTNFSGVLVSPHLQNKAVIEQLRSRGLPHAEADFENPREIFDIASWLQKQSIK